jgi:SAM-dependent methyltransferase
LSRRGVEPGVAQGGMDVTDNAGPYLTPEEEDRQAGWYRAHRRELYRQLGLGRYGRVLEVGCGSGAITAELAARVPRAVGVDVRVEALGAARARESGASFVAADAARLPFRAGAFDAVVTAFSLVWIANRGAFLREADRVLDAEGVFVALAEPDYEGIVEYPEAASTRELVVGAVEGWGGDPACGRKLPALLSRAAFEVFKFGVLNSAWTPGRILDEEEEELRLLQKLVAPKAGAESLQAAARAREEAAAKGERCYFLPIFYAAARKVR